MKKVLAAALLCSVYAFAAWDKFPVIEDGKGEFKINIEQSRQSGDAHGGLPTFKVRYSPLAGLELMSEAQSDAFRNYVLGARYQIISVLSAGVDFGFPLGDGANWSFKPNIQFSMPLTSSLTLGTNFDLAIYTATKKYSEFSQNLAHEIGEPAEYSRGLDFTGGIELDLALSEKSTIWVGFDAATGVTRSKLDGSKAFNDMYKQMFKDDVPLKDDDRLLTMTPAIGYIATLGNLELGTYVAFTIFSESDNETPNISTAVGVDASVKF